MAPFCLILLLGGEKELAHLGPALARSPLCEGFRLHEHVQVVKISVVPCRALAWQQFYRSDILAVLPHYCHFLHYLILLCLRLLPD